MQVSKNKDHQVPWVGKFHGNVKAMLSFLFWAIIFGVLYTQPLLYYSNQNQYFLHGLARGGLGYLDEDWLASTADPTPVFSWLVAWTYGHLHESLFYVYYLLILGVYFHSLVGIFTILSGRQLTNLMRLIFVTLFVALHSALVRWSSVQLFGVDYPWYFQSGVAGQYILGPGLQPSVFGVLLVLSVYTFLRDRLLLAVTWSSLAVVLHATYLPTAAFLTLAYLILLCREKRVREAIALGLWSFALVSPVVVYNLVQFAPSSPNAFWESQYLLVHFRLPHHAEPERWFDGIAAAQIAWFVLAMFLVRGSRLFPIFFTLFILSLALTLAQLATNSDTLALLFPWRTSVILIPLATTVILAKFVNRLALRFDPPSRRRERAIEASCGVILVVLGASGAAINYFELGYQTDREEVGLLEFIRSHKSRGEVYLLPVEVPKIHSGWRGSFSLNFTPPPKRGKQGQHISVDLQRFRLYTGAPIFVDFKSIPYKDIEVLEWRQRVLWNQKLYTEQDWDREEIKAEWARRRITHVVATADRKVRCAALDLVHEEGTYKVYRVRPSP
jgi:hypothetical protein